MNNNIISIQIWQLVTAYVFILVLVFIVKWRKMDREKEIIVASLRMTIQLTIVGYILDYVFKYPNPWITLVIIVLMESFAIYNVYRRVKTPLTHELKVIVAASLVLGSLICLFYFDFIVIHFVPWFDPRYFIPIAGMLIGNTMTGITLGLNTLIEGMKSRHHLIEAALMLGASPKKATQDITNHAFDNAIMPTINSMIGTGIVFLPGMMTGVILSGTSPIVAIKYQIAILVGITGSVALSVLLFTHYGYRAFFTKASQLK